MIRAVLLLVLVAFLCRAANVAPAAVAVAIVEMIRALVGIAIGLLRVLVHP